jgi:hypothetical protein
MVRTRGGKESDAAVPWARTGGVVDGVESQGGLLLGHATREEGDSRNSARDSVLKNSHSGNTNLSSTSRHSSVGTGANHVGFQQSALKEDVVVRERLVHCSQHSLSHSSSDINREVTVHQDLRFDNWDESVGLADGSIAGECVGVLDDGDRGGSGANGVIDIENSSPLGKTCTLSVIFGTTSIKIVDPLCDSLVGRPGKGLDTFVNLKSVRNISSLPHLDARDDPFGLQNVNKWDTSISGLVEGLLIEDDTRNVLFKVWGGEQQLSVLSAVGFIVLNFN